MVRIAYVCADSGVPVFGSKGASVHVQEVVRALQRLRADVTLFAARQGGEPPPDLRSVALRRLPSATSDDPATRERQAVAANCALRRALRDSGPFDLVYERYSLWSHAGMEYAAAANTPGILEVNAPLVREQRLYRTLVHDAAADKVARRVFAAARALVAVSPGVVSYLRGFPSVARRTHLISNGVDPARFPASRFGNARVAGRRDRALVVGFLGTLKPWHGLDTLLDAFSALRADAPEAALLIVGDGPERGSIRSKLARRNLATSVRMTGAVAPSEVPHWLARMDVAVAPYPDMRPFYFSPLKIHEYMAAGLPVVASRVGHLDKVISHGASGLLYPAGDVDALAASLRRLHRDPSLRRRMGRVARETALSEHSWEAVARRILRLADDPSRDQQAAVER